MDISRLGIFEILEKVQEFKTLDERAKWLKRNDTKSLRTILQYTFDETIKWDLPEGVPPYKPCEVIGSEMRLVSEARILYLFLKNGILKNDPVKREQKYIELLESIHPRDAQMLNHIKDKRELNEMFPKVNKRLVNRAFPGLING